MVGKVKNPKDLVFKIILCKVMLSARRNYCFSGLDQQLIVWKRDGSVW